LGVVFFTKPLVWGMWLISIGCGLLTVGVGMLLRLWKVRDPMTEELDRRLAFPPIRFVLPGEQIIPRDAPRQGTPREKAIQRWKYVRNVMWILIYFQKRMSPKAVQGL